MRKVLIVVILFLSLFGNIIQGSSVEATGKQFRDVPNNHSNKEEIDYLVGQNIIRGYPDGRFKPGNAVTNGQAAMMVARALKLNFNGRPNPNFSDVFSTTSGFKEIAALVDEGIIPKADRFNPGLPITRESMARILVNAFKLDGVNHVNFIDVPTSYWAYSYITKLAANDITTGYLDGTFRPKNTVTRGHFAAFMARALNPAYQPAKRVTRGVSFDMNVGQVEKIESARLVNKEVEGHITKLTYETFKYGYYVHLYYYFEYGQLSFIVYDFLPYIISYDTYYEMEALHNVIHWEAAEEFGEDYFFHSNNYSKLITSWDKNYYVTLLSVHDDNFYTTAQLLYAPNRYRMQQSIPEIEQSLDGVSGAISGSLTQLRHYSDESN
ncbi:S-layer homology domain-containing protein [Sporosarcina ureilytica]|uniref:SLH domain-containing protein n=1 Tax=Sporosarcina ureilytica TaxID=298596 RepID=A0A1D8JJ83_9BACL|nr:S-layer homology domain-containing protein [Sporosarcina ureilytica]AOV08774.1 hypothetical protein BI350_15295 [Sporosarcina ureilytica]